MTRTAFRLAALLIGLLAGSSLAHAQASDADVVLRIDQLQSQVRQLTGSVEQLQYRNQQLEQALRKMQEDYEYRFQELSQKGARGVPSARAQAPVAQTAQGTPQPAAQSPYPPPPYQQSQSPQYQPPQSQAPQYQSPPPPRSQIAGGSRADAFDPAQNPGAPGAPRALGSMSAAPEPPPAVDEAPTGGRAAGSPLDLATLAANAANDPGSPGAAPSQGGVGGVGGGALPPPPARDPSATGGRYAALPPTQSPHDEYDLAYGFMLRKDFAQAEEAFRAFLGRYPNDRMSPDAQYWLGESFFQRQDYRDAADAFLTMSKKYEASPKAAEGLLRLAQSLTALNEKELACATFGEITRKYPRASTALRQAIEREQKRVHC
jgi:tol-pal system protein YbgF